MAVHLLIEDVTSETPARSESYDQSRISIGRDPNNVVRLLDASNMVSRRHAAIRQGRTTELMDLGSRNGTFLNDVRIEPQRAYTLSDGDIIRIGTFRIEYRHIKDDPTVDQRSAAQDALMTQFLRPEEARSYDLPDAAASREALHRAVEELKILHELALSVASVFDTEEIMNRIVERSVEFIGAEEGLISLLDEPEEENASLIIHTMIRTGQSFRLNAYLREWMLRHMEPLLLNDPTSHPDFRNVSWEESLRNLITVPLMVRDELFGLLTVYNKKAGRFTQDDLRLLSIIGSQSSHIIHNARLFEEQQKLVRMEEQMGIALDIQRRLLPSTPPTIEGYDVAGESIAAQTVGGDHFDYIDMSEGRFALAVGDVSGKGLPAALVMANLQATLRAQTMWSPAVKDCVESTNLLLYRSTNSRTFVTLFYGVLDTATHQLTYANAGHNRPYICEKGRTREVPGGGFLLGGIASTKYEEYVLDLKQGATLVIFSDGVVEARRADGVLYGDERLATLITEHDGLPAQEMVDVILDDVEAFAGGEPQADDITLLVLRRH